MTTNQPKTHPAEETTSAAVADSELDWSKPHLVLAGTRRYNADSPPEKPDDERRYIEPWLSALCQAEHLNLLVGSGLTNALATWRA